MTIHINRLIEFLAELSEKKNLMVTTSEVLKGGFLSGCSAVVGGLILGPVGLAIGGAIGGLSSSMLCNDFKPLASVLRQLTPAEKNKLANHLTNAFCDFGIEDVAALSALLFSSTSFQERAIAHLSKYLANEMKMRVQN